jgi:hypothetical protein
VAMALSFLVLMYFFFAMVCDESSAVFISQLCETK